MHLDVTEAPSEGAEIALRVHGAMGEPIRREDSGWSIARRPKRLTLEKDKIAAVRNCEMPNKNEQESDMIKKDARDFIGKKVGGYVRVSTFEQAEKGTSIYEQKRIIREECKKRGWQLVEIFSDEGVSGKITDRQGLHSLQRDVDLGKFQVIMFTKSDRLTRSIRDLSNLWHDWTEAGLEIICVEQPEINSEGLCGKMIRNLLGIFAEWERDAIIERTASGRLARWRNNEAIIGSLPYGYEFDKEYRRIVFHPDRKAICQRIFNMYLKQRLTTRDIALRFTSESIPTPRGRGSRWNHSTINLILNNPAYTGKAQFNKFKYKTCIGRNGRQHTKRTKDNKDGIKWITIKFPPIISRERYLKIRNLMQSNALMPKRKFPGYDKHFLLDNILLLCGECGGKMKKYLLPKKNMPGEYYAYYRCYWHKVSQKELSVMGRTRCYMRVHADTLDNIVLWQVIEYLSNIVILARELLLELNLERIMKRFQEMRATVSAEHKVIRRGHDSSMITDHRKLSKISEGVIMNPGDICTGRVENLPQSIIRYDLGEHEFDRLDEFEKGVLRMRSKRLSISNKIHYSAEISCLIGAMSFEQKRQVVESAILIENGGKCILRWATQCEVPKNHEALTAEEANRRSQIRLVNDPPVVEINFTADVNRLQTLIWGMKRE